MDCDRDAGSVFGEDDGVPAELENLRTVTMLMGAAVTRCSRDLRYLWVSPEYARWIGRDVDAVVGHPIVEVLGPAAFETVRPYIEQVLAGERVEFEFEADFPAIGRRSVHAIYVPTGNATGAPTGWVARVDDITGRIDLENAQTRLAAIVEGSDDAIVGKTLDGIVTSWNSGAERLFGHSAEEMIGQPIQRIVPPDRHDDVERILSAIRRGHRVDHYETERIRKDGRRIYVSLTVSPIRNRSGRIVGASKIARDVTDRRIIDANMRESLDILTTLNRSGTMLSAELDLKKVVQKVTDTATELVGARFGAFFYNSVDERGEVYTLFTLSGAPREAFSGFPMPRNTALFEPTFRGAGIVRIDDVRRDDRYGRNPPYHGLPDGHLPVASYLAVPVTLRGRVLGGLFFGHPQPGMFSERHERIVAGLSTQAAIAIDNAELYQAERKARADAERASRAKDEFLSVVSHELRTPLASMMSWLAVVRQGKLPAERMAVAFDTIERNGRIQTELIDDLLDISRIVAGRLRMELIEIDIVELINAALDGVRPDAAAAGVALHADLPGNVTIVGDPIRLQQAVANVLANAIKFTPHGGHVEIRLEPTDDGVAIAVTDTGKGIAPEFLPHVFEPFRQADDVRKRKSRGLGLGLTIVKNLIEQHGGAVSVTSPGEGQGATFTMTLPRAADRPSPPPQGEEASRP